MLSNKVQLLRLIGNNLLTCRSSPQYPFVKGEITRLCHERSTRRVVRTVHLSGGRDLRHYSFRDAHTRSLQASLDAVSLKSQAKLAYRPTRECRARPAWTPKSDKKLFNELFETPCRSPVRSPTLVKRMSSGCRLENMSQAYMLPRRNGRVSSIASAALREIRG